MKTKILGLAKPTSVLKPSSLSCAQSPLPAYVVTTPAVVTFLTTLFSPSATYKFPELSATIEPGLLNDAEAPIPSK